MYPIVQHQGWGFGPSHPAALPTQHFSRPFAGVQEATYALTPSLFRAANELRAIYGTAPAAILANLFAVIAFAAAGNCRICGHNGNPMSLALHVDLIALPLSGKSDAYNRLIHPVREGMRGWPHQWQFGDITPSTLLRTIRQGAVYGFLGMDEGMSYLESLLSKKFDVLSNLHAGDVPPFSRSDESRKTNAKAPQSIIFGTCVNTQPIFYTPWLEKHKERALGSGYLYRKLIFRSDEKAQAGTSQQPEVALSVLDVRVIEMVTDAVQKMMNMEPNQLPVLAVSAEAEQVIAQATQMFCRFAEQHLPPRDAEVFAVRLAANVRRIAGCMHTFENYPGAVSADTMARAVTIGEFAAACWLEMVFPFTLPPQEIMDAHQLELHLQRHQGRMSRTDLRDIAPNFNWSEKRMESAVLALCGNGRALSIPRIERGRRRVMIELQGAHPLLLGNI